MAYIPDDAIRAKREISGVAWDVYEAHCVYRNHSTGYSLAKKETIAADCGLQVKSVQNGLSELKKAGWIAVNAEGIFLIKGDFSAVNRGEIVPVFPQIRETISPNTGNEGVQFPQIRETLAPSFPKYGKDFPQIRENVSPNTGKKVTPPTPPYKESTSKKNQPIEPAEAEEASASAPETFSPFEIIESPTARFANTSELDAALQILRDVTGANGCPPFTPNLHSQTALENTLRQIGYHLEAWRDSCLYWTGNGAKDFQKLLNNYTRNKLLPGNQPTNGATRNDTYTRSAETGTMRPAVSSRITFVTGRTIGNL